MLCVISKFQNGNTFASGAIYSILGILEWASLIILGLIYYLTVQQFDIIMWVIVGSLGLLYLINIPATIIMLTIIRKDKKMQFFLSPCQNKASYSVAIVLSTLISHKYNHILFSRLFNFGIFKGQL